MPSQRRLCFPPIGEQLTVRPLVSGIKKYITTAWKKHQNIKMIYVFQRILAKATGQANWFSKLAPLTASPEKAKPLALISKERTSTGYRTITGVIPSEKTILNMNIRATIALAESTDPVRKCVEDAMATPSHTRPRVALVKRRRGRRPMRSARSAPETAMTNWRQEKPRFKFVCAIAL